MRIGIFADAHDHVDNVRRAVHVFREHECDLVLFAGDFVSPIVVPSLRRLGIPVVACFGDNEGNKTGIVGGMRIVGDVAEPPVCVQAHDGTRILLTHVPGDVRDDESAVDIVVTAHTHKPRVGRDERGRLHVCPGETSGWTYRKPTVAVVETSSGTAEIVELGSMPPPWEPNSDDTGTQSASPSARS